MAFVWEPRMETDAENLNAALGFGEAYTATLTSTTLGDGELLTRYRERGTTVTVWWVLSWGSTTSGNMPALSVPETPATLGGMRWSGAVTINPGSGRFRDGRAWLYDSSTTISTGALMQGTSHPEIETNMSTAGVSMSSGGWIMGSIEYERA